MCVQIILTPFAFPGFLKFAHSAVFLCMGQGNVKIKRNRELGHIFYQVLVTSKHTWPMLDSVSCVA